MTGPTRERRLTRSSLSQFAGLTGNWPHRIGQSFGPYDSTVPTVRSYARVVLAEWGLADSAATAELVLSELVTNALQAMWRFQMHGPMDVRLYANVCWLVLEVWDCVPAVPQLEMPDLASELADDDESDVHGRGLMIVETVSHRWGYLQHPEGGKVVYAILAL